MARIRSLKPEFWDDGDLAGAVCRDARLLYMGLWTLADEHGRLRGDPRFVKGKLLAYDDDLTPGEVDKLLEALADAGKVVRYHVGRESYLYLPNLGKHQRLEPDKVPSRLPPPPAETPQPPHDPNGSASRADESAPDPDESALLYVAGSREQGAGSRGRGARARDARDPTTTALAVVPDPQPPETTDALLGEWLEHCRKRPPAPVIGQVGKQVKAMLAEGIDHADIRAGLAAWWRKGVHPSVLPSMVNELMNASPAQARASPQRPSTTDQRFQAGLDLALELDRREIR